jgi:hypothetical protein
MFTGLAAGGGDTLPLKPSDTVASEPNLLISVASFAAATESGCLGVKGFDDIF